jgi:hypothetical protein
MRKIHFFLMLKLLLGATLLSGCGKDQEELVYGFPSINFKEGENYTSEDITLNSNGQILVGILADMHSQTQKALVRFTLRAGTTNLVDSTFKANTFDADYTISFSEIGNTTLTARIADEGGFSNEASFNITIEEGNVKAMKNDDILIDNAFGFYTGSFYSAP